MTTREAYLVSSFPLLGIQDEIDTSVNTKAPREGLQTQALGIEDHGLAARVKLEGDALVILLEPGGRQIQRKAEPMVRPRGAQLDALVRRLELLTNGLLERGLRTAETSAK